MEFLASHQFKALHRNRRQKSLSIVGIRKTLVEKIEQLDDRTLRFTISTSAIDRDMDTVDVKGWDLTNYAKNPVVLWAHRADELPVGKAIDVGTDGNRLFSAVRFLPVNQYGSASDFAETIYRMAADGFLSATSVGFRPIKWDFSDDPERSAADYFPGIDFHQQELVELSIVSVPSNPDALLETIEPGGGDRDSAPVISPAPVQVISYERERRKRRALAASVGVFAQ
jgi:HK97 family phage prohead protease